MPFTLAHPAAALPLALLPRKYVCMTGLVVGAIVPDFEYIIGTGTESSYSHTIGGLFYFCLSVGLLACFLFHNIIRDSLIGSLPRFLKARFGGVVGFDWNGYFVKRWYVVILSILVGAGLHILWDVLTIDPSRWIYKHISTFAGLITILAVIWRLPKDSRMSCGIDIKYWMTCAVFFVILMPVCFLIRMRFDYNVAVIVLKDSLEYYCELAHVAVSFVGACFMAITVTSLVWRLKKGRDKSRPYVTSIHQ